jgi:nucleoside-diphosphate-sugar epimerase
MNDPERTGGPILVLGRTGEVGQAIVKRLRATGSEARIFSRSAPDSADAVRGDIRDLPALEAAMAGVRSIVNAVGILRETPDQTFHQVHVVGTQNAVLAAQNSRVDRFIHVTG